MDNKDQQLLQLLVEDSSRPLKTLGAAVGLSRSSVRDRIARLRQNGTIKRYTVELDRGHSNARVVLLLKLNRTPDPEVVRAITRRSDVVRCYSLSGPIDLFVELNGPDIAALNKTRDEIAQTPGVAAVETSLVLNLDKALDDD